jgi:two-component system response regulator AtoC
VILITAYGSVEEAVTAMKEGAFDFIQKPVDLDHLETSARTRRTQQELLRENLLLREEYAARYGFPRIVGEHPGDERRQPDDPARGRHRFHRAASRRERHGQGTVRARVHHLSSPRAAQPFVALNCAAIPEGPGRKRALRPRTRRLHRRGRAKDRQARTRPSRHDLSRRNRRAAAGHSKQAVARAGRKRFERVGGTQEIEVNVRIVTATNKNLQAAVADKSFREDLFFRISAVPITIPPLRERGDDVLAARRIFSRTLQARVSQARAEIHSKTTRARLRSYSWPGNVRELQNAVERAAILANGPDIDASGLQLPAAKPSAEQLPEGMLEEQFSVGRSARRSVPARRGARRTLQDTERPARIQVE